MTALKMSNGMYEVIALIPSASDFSLEKAVAHFGTSCYRKTLLRSELAQVEGESSFTGFRVWYGDWTVVAWLDEVPGVLLDSQSLLDEEPLPASQEIIASCGKRLCVWSDEDETGDHSDHITHFTDELRKRFGLLIYDPVQGGWWT
jgi:hypothetical protein